MKRKISVRSILILTLFAVGSLLGAENIRGRVAGTAVPDGNGVAFRAEELVVVDTGAVSQFQGGLEIRLQIPPALRRYQNSFALMVYRSISPMPTAENRAYGGNRAYMRLLPSRDGLFVRIPYSSSHQITGDALTDVLPAHVEPGDFPLIVTVLPVMKGIPDSAFREQMSLQAITIWKNQGTLSVSVARDSGNPEETITVFVDGEATALDETRTVEAGLHRIRVESTHAPTVEKTVAVEPGQQLDVTMELDYRSPELTINIPDGATLLLDGAPVSASTPAVVVEIEPGDHTITYRMGELDVSRAFTVNPGAKVSIDLIIEVDIVDLQEGAGNQYGAGDG